jgi:uncharacterized membrane protein YccC
MALATLREARRGSLLQVLKTSVATITAWIVAGLALQQELPIFAAIATLLVVQPSVNQSLSKGIERSIGVTLGVVLAYAAGYLFGSGSVVLLSAIVVALLISWALRLAPGSANQIPISAMLVLAIGGQSPVYAADRILETIIGALVGLIVNAAIVPPVRTAPARLSVGRLSTGVAAALDRLAAALGSEQDREGLDRILEEARELRPLQSKAVEDLEAAAESLTLNPRAGRHRRTLEGDRELFDRLTILMNRTIGMTRALHDNYDERLRTEPMAEAISRELRRAAHDVRLMAREVGGAAGGRGATGSALGRAVDAGSPSGATTDRIPLRTDDVPVLTAPLRIVQPDPEHWILVGSLLEDLRRIREEIIGEPGE